MTVVDKIKKMFDMEHKNNFPHPIKILIPEQIFFEHHDQFMGQHGGISIETKHGFIDVELIEDDRVIIIMST